MTLIDRYVYQVGRKLPKKIRGDVEAELNSLLMDTLEERLAEIETADLPAREAAEVQLLQEFGSPGKVAARYKPEHQYVIGPRFLQSYMITAGVVIGANLFGHLLGAVVSIFHHDDYWPVLGRLFADFFTQALTGIGAITVAFAIAERLTPEKVTAQFETDKQWNPRDLPIIEDHNQISIGWTLFGIAMSLALLVLFNVFPDRIGSYLSADDSTSFIPLLSPTFSANYLLLLNIWWGMSIVLNLGILIQHKWTLPARWVDFGLTVFGIFILFRLLTGPDILGVDPLWLAANPWAQELADIQIDNLIPLLSTLLKIGFGIGIFFSGIETLKKLSAAIRAGSPAAPAVIEKAR